MKEEKVMIVALAAYALIFLGYLSMFIGIGYIVVHFLGKIW